MNSACCGRILLVGEGNLSFSTAFVRHLPEEARVTASSLLTQKQCYELHTLAEGNAESLRQHGVDVLFEVDATKLHLKPDLKDVQFARIIFNFPHIGGKSKITKNRELLKGFFSSACEILAPNGEICVTLAQGQGGTPLDQPIREWHDSWQVVAVATTCDLILTSVSPFDVEDYPEYCSTGFRSEDRSFFTKGALTHIFERSPPPQTPGSKVTEEVNIDGQIFEMDAHIGNRLKRNLLLEDMNPIKVTKDCVEGHLKEVFMTSQLSEISSPIVESSLGTNYVIKNLESKESFFLMETLLERADSVGSDVDMDQLRYAYSPVYRRPVIGSLETPVQHEFIGCTKMKSFEDFKEKIETLLTSILPEEVQLLKPEMHCNGSGIWKDNSHSILDVSYRSRNAFITASCNHVVPTGPAEAKNSRTFNKSAKHSSTVCDFGRVADCFVFVLKLDAMAQILHNVPDQRIFLKRESGKVGIHPPMWRHDLSFWESDDFEESRLLDVIRSVAGVVLKQVLLVNKWAEPGSGRVSRCYREIYQSHVHAVSHGLAHQVQNAVRLTVRDVMGVELK